MKKQYQRQKTDIRLSNQAEKKVIKERYSEKSENINTKNEENNNEDKKNRETEKKIREKE